ncbi:MAG TPA: LPS export ABC transporter periplasmic protein LptC [Gammaproteobacteria bacterium]
MRQWFRHLPAGSRVAVVALLAAAGLGTWWWLGQQRALTPEREAARHPDSYFRALDIVRHDENGSPEMRVTADYAEHFENESWIHLRALEARGLGADSGWQLTANRGRLTDDGVELDVHGDVVLTRGKPDDVPMHLHTEALFVNTETEIAVTDEPVKITQGPSIISGRGLRVSLAEDYLRIESDVEARYENAQ